MSTELTGRQYYDSDGRLLFVHDGISKGRWWGTFRWRSTTRSLQRKKSVDLPMRTTRALAQQDLDAYATRRGLQVWDRP